MKYHRTYTLLQGSIKISKIFVFNIKYEAIQLPVWLEGTRRYIYDKCKYNIIFLVFHNISMAILVKCSWSWLEFSEFDTSHHFSLKRHYSGSSFEAPLAICIVVCFSIFYFIQTTKRTYSNDKMVKISFIVFKETAFYCI